MAVEHERERGDDAPEADADGSGPVTPRRVRRRVRVRKREKMPPRVRLALLIGLVIAALIGAFLAGRAFE